MRCTYCGGHNPDNATFCARCGRDLRPGTANRPPMPLQAPGQPTGAPGVLIIPGQPAGAPVAVPPRPPAPVRPGSPVPPVQAPSVTPRGAKPKPAAPQIDAFGPAPAAQASGPEAPAPFPPHNIKHLRALEAGALDFTELSEDTSLPGSKRIVRILYPRCNHWQQVATLLKAAQKYQTEKYRTLIIQGFVNRENSVYSFDNGQLVFDRGVRLGGQTLNRYQIETGTGFESEAVRIVLNDE